MQLQTSVKQDGHPPYFHLNLSQTGHTLCCLKRCYYDHEELTWIHYQLTQQTCHAHCGISQNYLKAKGTSIPYRKGWF